MEEPLEDEPQQKVPGDDGDLREKLLVEGDQATTPAVVQGQPLQPVLQSDAGAGLRQLGEVQLGGPVLEAAGPEPVLPVQPQRHEHRDGQERQFAAVLAAVQPGDERLHRKLV